MNEQKFNKISSKEKRILTLKTNVKLLNRWKIMFSIKINLSYADLRGADLRGANLRGANLLDADLRGADLRGANLSDASLRGADLRYANLRYTNLSYADLRGADLRGADLRGANLRYANLRYTNLRDANLDFSTLHFSCNSLKAKFDLKITTQILYHAAMPSQNNKLDLDKDMVELFNSDLFKKVVNKFHRVDECGEFKGVKDDKKG
jgi:uncharacterized protein YjbI with pentapeptide repeats